MRFFAANRHALVESRIEIIPENYFARLPLDLIFPRNVPLEVDVGCGDGAFLTTRAAQNPGRDFLGIERLLGRVRTSCHKAERMRLENVRVLRIESAYAVQSLLPPASVNVFHIAFPDPWPKRRHWRRRLLNSEFLNSIHAALVPGGEMHFSSDDSPYFDHVKTLRSGRDDFVSEPWDPDEHYPRTSFERFFRARGVPIHRLKLRKI